MSILLKAKAWSPQAVGFGIRALSWFASLTAEHPLGITAAIKLAAAIVIGSAAEESLSYFDEESVKNG